MMIQHGITGRGRRHGADVQHGRNVIDLRYNSGTRLRLMFNSDEERVTFALKVLGQLPAIWMHEHEDIKKLNAMTAALADNKTVRS